MNHPELMCVPVLMAADHLLTVAGARARENGYDRHIRTEHYELNPVWQKEIARKRWFNPRHSVLVLVAAITFYLVSEAMPPGDSAGALFFSGMLVGTFGAINGRHLANLATFRYLRSHPDRDIEGSISISHEYALRLSLHQHMTLLLPLALLCASQPGPLLAGGVAGIVLLMLLHAAWIAAWRRKTAGKARADAPR